MATQQTPPAGGPAPENPGLAARLGSKVRKWKEAAKSAQDERDKMKADLEAAQLQIKDLAGRADGNEAARQRDELAARLRTIEHRRAFDELATAAGAATEAQRNDLFGHYKVEGDVPDPQKITDLIKAQQTERPYLFGGQPAAGQTGQPAAPTKPGPAAGRGQSDQQNQGAFEITKEQANDPIFMRDNAARIWQASQENRFSIAGLLTR